MVLIHSGPTSAARPALSMGVQFWTSRGWVVAEVNYRGSTGYGRRYRSLLHHAWGVADVADCIAVAHWLADQGRADAHRMVIRGGSAGGFTALCAVAQSDAFRAAAVRYAVTDLAALAAETPRFESGYNDWLVGAPADQAQLFAERSPINHLADITTPLLVLHGSDDAVVPPSQARVLVDSLRHRGIAVTYEEFEGEGHGFRSADTLQRALAAEVAFFADVLGIDGAASGGVSGP
jgi:dipeptidyl aminopeptidase/acylaminoacyl peptidase